LTSEEESELNQLNGYLQAYDASNEKVISLVLASHPSLFPMHTPSSLLQSNAQDSEERAEYRGLWDKIASEPTQASKQDWNRLWELDKKYQVGWAKLVFPDSSDPKVKVPVSLFLYTCILFLTCYNFNQEFVKIIPCGIREHLYNKVMKFCMRMDQVEGNGPNNGPHKGRGSNGVKEHRLFSSSPGFKDTFNCPEGMGPELESIIEKVISNMESLSPKVLPEDRAGIASYLRSLDYDVVTHIVSYAEFKSLNVLAPSYEKTIISPGLCIEFWKKYLAYYCLHEGFPVIPLRFRSLLARLIEKYFFTRQERIVPPLMGLAFYL
jgi:hypothetical protein